MTDRFVAEPDSIVPPGEVEATSVRDILVLSGRSPDAGEAERRTAVLEWLATHDASPMLADALELSGMADLLTRHPASA
jgi:hypothetical protein